MIAAIFVGISGYQYKSWQYYKSGSNHVQHSRSITFPSHAKIEEVIDNDLELRESVAPPAEGEITQADSAATRPIESSGTEGAHTESNEIKIDKSEPASIKSEPLSSESTSKPTLQPIQRSSTQPVVPKSTTVLPTPVMHTGSGARVSGRNLNPIHVSLAREHGGMEVRLPDTTAAELPNVAIDHSDTSNCSDDVDIDACTFSTDPSSILSTPTTPFELAYPLATPPATELTSPCHNPFDDQFSRLNISKPLSTESDATLASSGDVGLQWAFAAKLSAPNDNPTTYTENLVNMAGHNNAYPADTPISPTTQLTQYEGVKPKFNFGTYIGHVTAVKGTAPLGLTYHRLGK
ncbi:unnamed protein product [Rhizoctonia solani]|uniref:Uncharacterized protein n=1 Tax=Rhizoctonia solani TaxID=456999 RepID=A0A8H3DQL7_9AGAM|nr:unnamed protein product [Rhizoctonia solani]